MQLALVFRVAEDLPSIRSLQLVARTRICFLYCLRLDFAHLETLTSQLSGTATTIAHALVFNLDSELCLFVAMVHAHFGLDIVLLLCRSSITPVIDWLLRLLICPFAHLPGHIPNRTNEWLLRRIVTPDDQFASIIITPHIVVSNHVLLVGQHASRHFTDGGYG